MYAVLADESNRKFGNKNDGNTTRRNIDESIQWVPKEKYCVFVHSSATFFFFLVSCLQFPTLHKYLIQGQKNISLFCLPIEKLWKETKEVWDEKRFPLSSDPLN